jgi:hypothetical protein
MVICRFIEPNMKRIAAVILLVGLSGCGEWKAYDLFNSAGSETACAVPWGQSLPAEDIQRLHQCVDACEAHGYHLKSSESLPPAVPLVVGAKPPSIPIECQS